ncbi:MAG: bifunctional demethylmenaquinone methyltransferase/2-methoxy-6-polyprenyl-1,4-benzoquinol methylase UbiE [Alphaproteobacteria bacterium]
MSDAAKHNDRNPEAAEFGYRPVDPTQKAGLVREVFDSVASRYDLMNDLMSGGIHRLWKHELIRLIRPRPGEHLLDVAGGTGDVAFAFLKAARTGGKATVCDINPSMLRVGRDRAINRGLIDGLDWVCGSAESLPMPDQSVDVYTIAFGLRNVTHIDDALAEAKRVLKPGGRFYCLEFSHVGLPLLRQAYDAWSFIMIPRIGELVAGDRDSYQYLVESIRRFPRQEELADRMRDAGFSAASWRNLTGGIAAIHIGQVD